jgi:hypothetical protein
LPDSRYQLSVASFKVENWKLAFLVSYQLHLDQKWQNIKLVFGSGLPRLARIIHEKEKYND